MKVLKLNELGISVPAKVDLPSKPIASVVLAHGAGAGMNHHFMEAIAAAWVQRGIAVFRFEFPYMAQGRKAPDRPPKLTATIAAAVEAAQKELPGPIFLSGKSMGGRMGSTWLAEQPDTGIKGIIFLGFPLHAPGRDGKDRAAHLANVKTPMLFVQGTRDKLANYEMMTEVIADLGTQASLYTIEHGDHSFGVPKKAGKTPEEVIAEIADTTVGWIKEQLES